MSRLRNRTAIEPAHPQNRFGELPWRLLADSNLWWDELLLAPNIGTARQRGPTLDRLVRKPGFAPAPFASQAKMLRLHHDPD